MAAVRVRFPPGTRINWMEKSYGKDPRIVNGEEGRVMVVATDSTVNMGVVVGGTEYQMRVQDGGVRGGARAVVDVIMVESLKLRGRGEKKLERVLGVTARWFPG